ncbi:hypothetical protein TNCV_4712731 [Trichonephila clavipes]|nr:hypothetical protein TNCV_4712731 [Trichonephila clavipes]
MVNIRPPPLEKFLCAPLLPINHWIGSADSVPSSLRDHSSSFLLVISGAATHANFYSCVRRRRKKTDQEDDAEDPRHLPNRVFKPSGWASAPVYTLDTWGGHPGARKSPEGP